MTMCQMEHAVTLARLDEARARREARWAIAADLHRLAGLAPPPSVFDGATGDPPPGHYCRLWQRVVAWVLPKAAAAQVPAVARPPSLPAITPGAGYGEEARVQGARQRAATYEVEIQKKLTIATACIVFALVGIPVALRFPRGGVGLVIGTSVVVFAIYYIGLIGGEDLGDRLILSPFLAMWTPNLIFCVVGLVGLWIVRSEGSPARGGDWSDVRQLLLGWLRPGKAPSA
jgi:hypothetical protein